MDKATSKRYDVEGTIMVLQDIVTDSKQQLDWLTREDYKPE